MASDTTASTTTSSSDTTGSSSGSSDPSSSSSSSSSSSNSSLTTINTTNTTTTTPRTSSSGTSSGTSSSSSSTLTVSRPSSIGDPPEPQPLLKSLIPSHWCDARTVRTVPLRDHRQVGLTLALAFAADDYARYLVDGPRDMAGWSPEKKWKVHLDMLTYTAASHCLGGLVTTVGVDWDSVALWIPPGKNLDGLGTLLRSGTWRLYYQLSPEGRKRLFEEILPLLHDTKRAVLGKERDHDSWYLVYLGTKPNSQGRGYGSRLLKDMMARADAENRPIYLESSSLANNVYYEKFGFEIKKEISLTRGPSPVRLSIMVREPVSTDNAKMDGGAVAVTVASSLEKKLQKKQNKCQVVARMGVTAAVCGGI